MKAVTRYIVAALCVVSVLGVAFAACDTGNSSTDQARAQAATIQAEVGDRPVARYDEGGLTLAVSKEEAREIVLEATDGLLRAQKVRGVTFEEPVVEMVGNRPYLMMRGKQPDGNCALAFVRLASEEARSAGTAQSISEVRTPEEKDVELYKTVGGTCTGAPCSGCHIVFPGDTYESCDCHGTGSGGEPGFCNHSTGG